MTGTPSGSGPSDKASGMEPTGKEPKLLITPEAYVLLTENLKAENAKLLREREEIIQQLATERDAFGKREIELMQKLNLAAEALNRGIERLKAVDQKHSGFTLKVMEEVITKLRPHEKD